MSRPLYRFMVRADECLIDGRSMGIYEREVWATDKRAARKSYPCKHYIRPRILSVRQVGGKREMSDANH